jgi:hypothetical protein
MAEGGQMTHESLGSWRQVDCSTYKVIDKAGHGIYIHVSPDGRTDITVMAGTKIVGFTSLNEQGEYDGRPDNPIRMTDEEAQMYVNHYRSNIETSH